MEWPLPLWQVLGKELNQLRKPVPLDPATYEYQPDEIINAVLLREQLELRRPELKPLLAKATAAAQTSEFGKYFVSDELAPPVSRALPDADFLNLLLKIADLYLAFPALAESAWIGDQDPGQLPLSKIIQLNRR